MPRVNAQVRFADDYLGRYRRFQTLAERRLEAASLIATDIASRAAVQTIRQQMSGAGLGRLGNAIGQTSDIKRGSVHRRGDGFSASGILHLRSRSPRTIGAIESYTEGSEIRPVRGRWLWIATDEIPGMTKRERMTPELYRRNGLESRIGPLVQIRGINGYPLLVVQNVGVSEAGLPRRARNLKKSGQPRKGQRLKQFVVAFVAIPRTARAARVDVNAIVRAEQARLPDYFAQALERTVQ